MTAALAEAPWVKDAFLSRMLGKAVYRLLEPWRASEAVSSVGEEEAWMIEAKVSPDATSSLGALGDLGFRLIDTNVQLDGSRPGLDLGSPAPTISVREARPEDRPAVEQIAADNLITSRFHLDRQIGPEMGSRIKRAWAGNYFEGRRGDGLLVAECNGSLGAFLLVIERGQTGIIDLIALDPILRGLGTVGALVGAWLAKSPKIERVLVGTQISNLRSLRAYGKLGFRICGAMYVLHRHGGLPQRV